MFGKLLSDSLYVLEWTGGKRARTIAAGPDEKPNVRRECAVIYANQNIMFNPDGRQHHGGGVFIGFERGWRDREPGHRSAGDDSGAGDVAVVRARDLRTGSGEAQEARRLPRLAAKQPFARHLIQFLFHGR